MEWMYNGKPFDPPEEERENWTGFIYEITDTENGMKYIGQKKLWSKVTRPPLKGRRNKRRSLRESDWKSYYGSSEELKSLVENTGEWRFKRKVLWLCKTKGEMNYVETYLQLKWHVLTKPEDFYNGFVGCKIHRKHVRHLTPKLIKQIEEL